MTPVDLPIKILGGFGLKTPCGVRVSPNGTIIVADSDNHSFRVIDIVANSSSVLTGLPGVSKINEENVDAMSAGYGTPRNMDFGVIDGDEVVFLTDSNNHRIRMLNMRTKLVSTFAGCEVQGFNQDGILANQSGLFHPAAITVHGENMYISDTYNFRIRKVNLKTRIISTIVGTGQGGYSGDGGLAINATIQHTHGLVISPNGNELIFTDTYNHVIRKVNLTSGIISTIAGTGSAGFSGEGLSPTSAKLFYPKDVLFYNNELYLADTINNRIRKISNNKITTHAQGTLSSPESIAVHISKKKVSMLIADSLNNQIQVVERICANESYVFDSTGTVCVPAGVEEVAQTNPQNCSSHGNCTNFTQNCTSENYFGKDCNLTTCFGIISNSSNVCNGHGGCQAFNSCQCDAGWTGSECQFPTCQGKSSQDPTVCSGRGSCTAPNFCSCSLPSFFGVNCELQLDCFGKPISLNDSLTDTRCSGAGGAGQGQKNGTFTEIKIETLNLQELNGKKVEFEEEKSVGVKFPNNFDGQLNEIESNKSVVLVSSISESNSTTLELKSSDIVSPIVDISLYSNQGQEIAVSQLTTPIEIFFNLTFDSSSNITCMYFDTDSKSWKSDGITTILLHQEQLASNQIVHYMKCQTTHLTSFAIIDMNLKKTQLLPGNSSKTNNGFVDITLIGIILGSVAGFIVVSVLILSAICATVILIRGKRKSAQNRKNFAMKLQNKINPQPKPEQV